MGRDVLASSITSRPELCGSTTGDVILDVSMPVHGLLLKISMARARKTMWKISSRRRPADVIGFVIKIFPMRCQTTTVVWGKYVTERVNGAR